MNIEGFIRMWETDNAVEKMILVDETKHDDGTIDRLYHVLYKGERGGNGRHEALRVRISKDKKVLEHDVLNIAGNDWGRKDAELGVDARFLNYTCQTQTWYNTWVGNYSLIESSSTGSVNYVGIVQTSTMTAIGNITI